MNSTKGILQSKLVWLAILGLISAVLLFQYNIEIPEDATTKLAEKLAEAITAKNIGAGAIAIMAFFTATFRIWFTNKRILTE